MVRPHAEIDIRDVASADNSHGVVHDEQLVMHPVVDAAKVGQEAHDAPTPVPHRVKETDLDVGMCVERRNAGVSGFRHIMVVDQQAHADAAVRGTQQPVGQDQAGSVAIPDVVLAIQSLFSQLSHRQPGHERGTALSNDGETG